MSKAETKAKQFGSIASHARFLLGANIAAGIFYLAGAERLNAIYMQNFMSALGAGLAMIVLAASIEAEWKFQQLEALGVELGDQHLKVLQSGRWMVRVCIVSAGALLWGAVDHGMHLLGLYEVQPALQVESSVPTAHAEGGAQ